MVRTLSIKRRSCENYFFTGQRETEKKREKFFVQKIFAILCSKIWLQQCLIYQPTPCKFVRTFTALYRYSKFDADTCKHVFESAFESFPPKSFLALHSFHIFARRIGSGVTRFYHSGLDCTSLLVNYRRIDYSYTEFLPCTVKNETIIAIFFHPPLLPPPCVQQRFV